MSTVSHKSSREHRVTVPSLAGRKRRGEKISMLTAYDFSFAQIFDASLPCCEHPAKDHGFYLFES